MSEITATAYIEDIDENLEVNFAKASHIDSMTAEQISIYLKALNDIIKEMKEDIEYVDMVKRN